MFYCILAFFPVGGRDERIEQSEVKLEVKVRQREEGKIKE